MSKRRTLDDFWEPAKKKPKKTLVRDQNESSSDNNSASKTAQKDKEEEDCKEVGMENELIIFDETKMNIDTVTFDIIDKYPKLCKLLETDESMREWQFKIYKLDNNNSEMLECQSYLNDSRFTNDLFNELICIPYEQPTLRMWGKNVKIPRLQSWMADKGVKNKESSLYQKGEAQPWFVYFFFFVLYIIYYTLIFTIIVIIF